MINPASTAEMRMPVPVAESQLSLNSAASGLVGWLAVGGGTTGGVRTTTLCSPGMAKLGAEIRFRAFFTAGTPQIKTSTLRRIHGIQACRTRAGSGASTFVNAAPEAGVVVAVVEAVEAVEAAPAAAGIFQASRGFQTLSSATRAIIEQSEARISTSQGPWKLATTNCGTANASPAVSAAGQTPSMPRQPAKAQTTQNGTMREKSGSWRPTMAESLSSIASSPPITPFRAMMGVPSAPKATGAVLAMSDRPEAWSGLKPSWIRIAAVTATGVPNPAAPSKNAPNEKAIRIT